VLEISSVLLKIRRSRHVEVVVGKELNAKYSEKEMFLKVRRSSAKYIFLDASSLRNCFIDLQMFNKESSI